MEFDWWAIHIQIGQDVSVTGRVLLDNLTKFYGEKPTPEQILEMTKYKGVMHQRKGNDNSNKSYQNIPKAITTPNADLSIDLGSWISNAKVLVPMIELIKIPSQKDRLLKAIEGPTKTILTN
jgi:hypothetical protein